MRVKTPAMKLDVQLESACNRGGLLPCEVTLAPAELRRVLAMVLRPSILGLLLRK